LKDNLGTELATPGSDISTKGFPTNYPAIRKYWGQANTEVDVEFTLISSFPLNDTCRVTVDFPAYYARGLSTRGSAPTCTIDGTPTRCWVTLRSLAIDGFPVSKSVNTAFVIRVSGISAPASGAIADNFWVQINQASTEAAASVVYGGSVKDVIPTISTINGLHVNWHTSSSLITRSLTTLTWVMNPLNNEDHNNTRGVQVIFPPWWGLAHGRFNPTCRIYDYLTPSTIYTGASVIVGNRVNLPIQTTILQNRVISLECQNVRTPENDGTYPSQDIQIRIVDIQTTSSSTPTAIYQHSAPSVHNVNYNLGFAKLSNLNYINWNFNTASEMYIAPGFYTLPRGTFGVDVTLNVPGRSSRDFQVTVAPGLFGVIDNVYNISTGYDSYNTVIGCGGSVPVNTYALLFTLSDSTVYTVPAAQWVTVTNDQVELRLETSGDISIQWVSGTASMSNPITFYALPFSDVTITPGTAVDNTNFTVVPESVTLTPSIWWGSFVYKTTGSTGMPTGTSGSAAYEYAVSGTNAASYKKPEAQVVKTVADTNNYLTATPTLTITADGSDQSGPVSKLLNWNLGGVDTATAYFGCQIVGTWVLDKDGIYNNAVTWGLIDPMAPQQGQYDWEVLNKQTTSTTVGGLIPNTWYECRGFVVSQSNKTSAVAAYSFRTGSNGGTYNRFLFNHSTYPTPAQRQVLLCTLIQRLQVDKFSVIAVTGETCGNNSAFYNVDNSSGLLAVYFVPRIISNDDVMTLPNLQASLNTTANFQALNASVVTAGGLQINNIIADGQPKRTAVNPTFPSTGTVDTKSVAVTGCSLNDTGYIIAILGTNQSTATPIDLYMGSSSNFLGYQIAYYAPSLGSVGFNFSNLQASTSYNLFLVGSNDDPSHYFSNVTAVSTVQLTTSTPVTDSGLALFCSIMMALIAMISILV
jgi:hypothetical protein